MAKKNLLEDAALLSLKVTILETSLSEHKRIIKGLRAENDVLYSLIPGNTQVYTLQPGPNVSIT